MLRGAIFAAMLFLGAASAHATGGFDCTIDDANLKFDAQSAFSRGLGEQLVNFRAEAEVLAAGTPEPLRKLKLDDALVHSWLFGPDLKLRLYRETDSGPHAYVEIVIETRTEAEDDTGYEGTYTLIIYLAEGGESVFNGKASCSVG